MEIFFACAVGVMMVGVAAVYAMLPLLIGLISGISRTGEWRSRRANLAQSEDTQNESRRSPPDKEHR